MNSPLAPLSMSALKVCPLMLMLNIKSPWAPG